LRKATIKDLDSLIDVENKGFEPDKYHLTSKRQYRYLLNFGRCDILIIENNTDIIGTATVLYRKNSNKARLYSIAINPKYRQNNFGSTFIELIENYLKDKKYKSIISEFRADKERYYSFYKERGYRIQKQIENYYPDGCHGVRVIKELI